MIRMEHYVRFSTCSLFNKNLYFFSNNNIPMKMNLESNKISILENLEGFEKNIDNLDASPVLALENKVYKIGYYSGTLLEINLENGACKYISNEIAKGECFVKLVKYNEFIIAFSDNCGYIYQYDLRNNKVNRIDYLGKKEKQFGKKISDILTDGSNAYIFLKEDNSVISIDFSTNGKLISQFPNHINSCCSVYRVGSDFYILNEGKDVYKWNIENQECNKIYSSSNNTFYRIVIMKNTIVLLPSRENEIELINLENGISRIFHNYPSEFEYVNSTWSKYYGYAENETNIYFSARTSNYILSMDKKNEKMEWIKSSIESSKVLSWLLLQGEIINESHDMSLKVFIG